MAPHYHKPEREGRLDEHERFLLGLYRPQKQKNGGNALKYSVEKLTVKKSIQQRHFVKHKVQYKMSPVGRHVVKSTPNPISELFVDIICSARSILKVLR